MNTRAPEPRARDVRLGRRRLKVGPLKFAWGGGWYRVMPMSVAQTEQFQARALELLNEASGSPADLARIMLEGPTRIVRVMAPIFVDGGVDPRHLSRATDEELGALAKAVADVNDFPAILLAMAEGLSLLGPGPWSAFSTPTTIEGATTGAPKEN